MTEIKKKVNKLYELVKDKRNVHSKVKHIVTSMKSTVSAVEREQKAHRLRIETEEEVLAGIMKVKE